MPRPIIEIGIRAMKADPENLLPPGVASSSRYGVSTRARYGTAPTATHRVCDDATVRTPSPYDAFLLVSFGGPEGPDDVLPFLENVTRGRGIPRERLLEVGEHYFGFGGVSPINAQNRALIEAI